MRAVPRVGGVGTVAFFGVCPVRFCVPEMFAQHSHLPPSATASSSAWSSNQPAARGADPRTVRPPSPTA
jgi:hypothetical protein